MKYLRSSKLPFIFATESKKEQLKFILQEYSKTVNNFIDIFWSMTELPKKRIGKPVYDMVMNNTWLGSTIRQSAAQEALGLVSALRNVTDKKKKISKPVHCGKSMSVSGVSIARLLIPNNTTEFNAWLNLRSIGNKIILDIPINFHKQYNRWNAIGRRMNCYVITEKDVTVCFEIESGPKRNKEKFIGVDTGVKILAATSTENKYGEDIEKIVRRVNRCKYGSKYQKQLRRYLKQRMNEVAKELIEEENPDVLVVEKLNNLNNKSKVKRRLTTNIRRVIGTWAYRYWLGRVEAACEENRVSFRSVPAYNTSVTCYACGHVDKKNRQSQEIFLCQKCGHADNADTNAAKNILDRFITGKYGPGRQIAKKG